MYDFRHYGFVSRKTKTEYNSFPLALGPPHTSTQEVRWGNILGMLSFLLIRVRSISAQSQISKFSFHKSAAAVEIVSLIVLALAGTVGGGVPHARFLTPQNSDSNCPCSTEVKLFNI